jgi:hypothetical protein
LSALYKEYLRICLGSLSKTKITSGKVVGTASETSTGNCKVKAVPVQTYQIATVFQEIQAPTFLEIRHVKLVCQSYITTQKLSRTQSHRATGRIKSMKNSIDIIGNRNRDLAACNTLPQPTAPPRAPDYQNSPPKYRVPSKRNFDIIFNVFIFYY